jgi:MFS transporter, PAT family, beta-lactamase induction signal transducer AmpG
MSMQSVTRIWSSLAAYRDPRMLSVLLMGFSSGLPLALTGSTLSVRLTEAGVTLTHIGLFALVGLAYSFKFLWAPIVDHAPIPWAGARFGRRRAWAFVTQAGLMAALLALGFADPRGDLVLLATLAVIVAFLSASQDIVIDAYRVELLEDSQQGAGAAVTQYGYRLGMLASGAGALYLAEIASWFAVYAVMAGLVTVGLIAVGCTREPARPLGGSPTSLISWARDAFVGPFAEFFTRPRWLAILIFVVLFKFGDALAGVMSNPFYVIIGFTKAEIASIVKLFGLLATLLGVFLGGVLASRVPIGRALMLAGLLQAASNLMFVAQAQVGADLRFLVATIAIENLTGGIGSAVFVAYLSALCHRSYTATHYALLSSLAAVGRTTLSASGGWLAESLGWVNFFLVTTAAAFPGLILLAWLMRQGPALQPRPAPAAS